MAYGFTYTSPTIAGSHADLVWVFRASDFPTAAKDGGTSSLSNGGGNLTAYTDSTKTTQLPIHIIAFVTGGTPSIEVKVKHPSFATGSTVYFEADDTQTSQPAVGATYGRNSVYTAFKHDVALESNSTVDSTGNAATVTKVGSVTDAALTGGLPALAFDGAQNNRIHLGDTGSITGDFSAAIWANLDTGAALGALVARRDDTTSLWEFQWRVETNEPALLIASSSPNDPGGALSYGVDYRLGIRVQGTVISYFVNGVKTGTQSVSGSRNTEPVEFSIGGIASSGTERSIDGKLSQMSFAESALSDNWFDDEYDNQSAYTAGAWGTVGPWSEAGGGGGLIYEEAITAGTALDFNRSNTASLSSTMSSSISISTQLENNISIDSNIAYQWLLDANNTSNITANNNLLSNIDLTVDYFSNIAVQDSIIENTNLTESYLNSAIISAAVEEALSADTALTANLVVKEALEAQSSFNAYYNYGGIVEEVLISSISADYNLSNRITAENINSEALNVDVITSNNITKDINIQENIINNVLLTIGNIFEVSLIENVNTALTTQQNYIINETITSNLSLEDQIANRVSVIDSLTFENKVTVQYISNIIQDLNITEAVVTDVIVEGSRVKLYLSLPSKRTLTLNVESRVLTINKEDRVLKF